METESWPHQSRLLRRSFQHIDQLIAALEQLHLEDKTEVPDSLLPELAALAAELPPSLQPTRRWSSLIRDVIDQCFDLQEQLLRLENPYRAALADREAAEPGHEPVL